MQGDNHSITMAVGVSPTLFVQPGQSHQVEEYWTTLIKGSKLLKFGRWGQPHMHFFRLSDDQHSLQWESRNGRLRKVPLRYVQKVLKGQNTPVFGKSKATNTKNLKDMSMSLVYRHRSEERTLDIVCKTIEEADLWYAALKLIVEQVKQQYHLTHHRTHQTHPGSSTPTAYTVTGGGQVRGFASHTPGVPVSIPSMGKNIPGDCYIWGGCADITKETLGADLVKVNVPQLVPSSHKLDIIQVSAGPKHFCAVTRNGHLYTWGSGESGRLGLGTLQHLMLPATVDSLNEVSVLGMVSCGDCNTAAVLKDGSLYTWGGGLSGQLGHGNLTTQFLPKKIDYGLDNIKITKVSCGPYHTAAITDTGQLFTWGDGLCGKLGHKDGKCYTVPSMVENLNNVIDVSCGWWHTAAVCQEEVGDNVKKGILYTWGGDLSWEGDNNKGCLGNGVKTGYPMPYRVSGDLESEDVCKVSCGLNLTVALTTKGYVFQMGETGAQDQHYPWEGAKSPVRVEGPLKKVHVEKIACGKQHVCVVASPLTRGKISDSKKDSLLYVWGRGHLGQLGQSNNKDHTMPQIVEALDTRYIEHICCGGDYTLAVCRYDPRVAASHSWNPDSIPNPSTSSNPNANSNNNNTTIATGLLSRKATNTTSSFQGVGRAAIMANQLKNTMSTKKSDTSSGSIKDRSSAETNSIGSVNLRKMKSELHHKSSNVPSFSAQLKMEGHQQQQPSSSVIYDSIDSMNRNRAPSPSNMSSALERYDDTTSVTDVNLMDYHDGSSRFDHLSRPNPRNVFYDGNYNYGSTATSQDFDGANSTFSDPTGDHYDESSTEDGSTVIGTNPDESESGISGIRKRTSTPDFMQQILQPFNTPTLPFPPSSIEVTRSQQIQSVKWKSRQSGQQKYISWVDDLESGKEIGMSVKSPIEEGQRNSLHSKRYESIPENTAKLKSIGSEKEELGPTSSINATARPVPMSAEASYGNNSSTRHHNSKFNNASQKPSSTSHKRDSHNNNNNHHQSTLSKEIDQCDHWRQKLKNYTKLLQSIQNKLQPATEKQKKLASELNLDLEMIEDLLKSATSVVGIENAQNLDHTSPFAIPTDSTTEVRKILEKANILFKGLDEDIALSPEKLHEDETNLSNPVHAVKRYQLLLSNFRILFQQLNYIFDVAIDPKHVSMTSPVMYNATTMMYQQNDNRIYDMQQQQQQKAMSNESNASSSSNRKNSPSKENLISELENDNSGQSSSGHLLHVWMEQVDPGVSVIFQKNEQGSTKIKKIRFSKNRFTAVNAQRWWQENQARLVKEYHLVPGENPLDNSTSTTSNITSTASNITTTASNINTMNINTMTTTNSNNNGNNNKSRGKKEIDMYQEEEFDENQRQKKYKNDQMKDGKI